MATKREWLEAGLRILNGEGARALTIERLTRVLSVTKGSFYHHFKGMSGFKSDLLQHYEDEHTTQYISEIDRTCNTAMEKLQRLIEITLHDKKDSDDLEIAIRAWALQDSEVRTLQQRIDQRRIRYLQTLVSELCHTDTDAHSLGRALYLLFVGAQQLVPPVSPDELREIYAFALKTLPFSERRSI